jgi:hypothetical protein
MFSLFSILCIVCRYIARGVEEGAQLACGGQRHGDKGYYIQPTVFANVTDGMTIAKEEIFGPVMCALKYSTLDEVITRANATSYGLAATVVGQDINAALTVAHALESGTVYVLRHVVYPAHDSVQVCLQVDQYPWSVRSCCYVWRTQAKRYRPRIWSRGSGSLRGKQDGDYLIAQMLILNAVIYYDDDDRPNC